MYSSAHETQLPAKEAQARTHARISEALALCDRAQPPAPQAPQRPRTPFGLVPMPKKYRLTGEEIRRLSGKRSHGTYFSLLVAASPAGHAKFACVASKKAAARAVDRNAIKRRCRAILSKHGLSSEKRLAFVFYAKPGARGAPYAELERDITSLLLRA